MSIVDKHLRINVIKDAENLSSSQLKKLTPIEKKVLKLVVQNKSISLKKLNEIPDLRKALKILKLEGVENTNEKLSTLGKIKKALGMNLASNIRKELKKIEK